MKREEAPLYSMREICEAFHKKNYDDARGMTGRCISQKEVRIKNKSARGRGKGGAVL